MKYGEEVKQMTAELLKDIVSRIAAKHGCRVLNVDQRSYRISIEGAPQREYACARELEETLSRMLEPAAAYGAIG